MGGMDRQTDRQEGGSPVPVSVWRTQLRLCFPAVPSPSYCSIFGPRLPHFGVDAGRVPSPRPPLGPCGLHRALFGLKRWRTSVRNPRWERRLGGQAGIARPRTDPTHLRGSFRSSQGVEETLSLPVSLGRACSSPPLCPLPTGLHFAFLAVGHKPSV